MNDLTVKVSTELGELWDQFVAADTKVIEIGHALTLANASFREACRRRDAAWERYRALKLSDQKGTPCTS